MKQFALAIIACLLGISGSYSNAASVDMSKQENIELFNQHYRSGNAYLKGNIALGNYDGRPAQGEAKIASLRSAIREFNKCLEMFPDHWQSVFLKSIAHQALGEHAVSLNLMEQVIRLQPQNYVIYKEASLEAIHNHDIEKALRYSRRATELKDGDPELLGNHAMNLLIAGQDNEALNTIKRALQIAPDDRVDMNVKKLIEGVISGQRARPTVETVFE